VPRSVVYIIFLSVQSLICGSCSVFDQCKTSTMATELELLIELWQAPSFSQSRTNTPPTRFSKQFAEPVLLGPEPSVEAAGEELFRLLPPLPDAIHLCEVYREHGKYMQARFIQQIRHTPNPSIGLRLSNETNSSRKSWSPYIEQSMYKPV
jgi:hypothetical protein